LIFSVKIAEIPKNDKSGEIWTRIEKELNV